MTNYKIQKIETHIGPKRMSSKLPDGKALIIMVIKANEIFIDVYFDSRNIEVGMTVPSAIYRPMYDEIEEYIFQMPKLLNLAVGLVTLPDDSPNGAWPLGKLEKVVGSKFKTGRRKKEPKKI